jgi:hypothetical protein
MADSETQIGTRLSVYLSFTSVSAQHVGSTFGGTALVVAKRMSFLKIPATFG